MIFLGIGAGAYLSVDWALMTEVIPLASSGRYMGLANIANSLSGPMGLLMAGLVIDYFTRLGEPALGPRFGIGLGTILLMGSAIALIAVRPKRDPRQLAAV
jgi:MFS family permease